MREPRAKPVPAADVGANKTGNQPRTKRGLRDVKDVKDVRSSFAPYRIDLESNDLPRIQINGIRGSLNNSKCPTIRKGATLAYQE